MRHAPALFLALSAIALGGCPPAAVAPATTNNPSCAPSASAAPVAPAPFDPGDGQFDVVQFVRDTEAAVRAGRREEALSRLLWAFDYGPIVKQGSIGVVATTVPDMLVSLGKTYPPALRALEARKRWLEAALRAGERLPRSTVGLYEGAARALGQVDGALLTCKMLDGNAWAAEQRELLCGSFVDELLDAGMLPQAVAVADRLFSDVRGFMETEQREPGMPTFYRMFARRAARLFAAMLQLGKDAEARRFAERALDQMPRSYNYAGIIAAARAAGRTDMANEFQKRAALKLVE